MLTGPTGRIAVVGDPVAAEYAVLALGGEDRPGDGRPVVARRGDRLEDELRSLSGVGGKDLDRLRPESLPDRGDQLSALAP